MPRRSTRCPSASCTSVITPYSIHYTKLYDKYYDANGTEVLYPYPDGTAGLTKVPGAYNDYWGYMLKGNFAWQILEGLKFRQEASYRSDFKAPKTYFVYAKTALESKINSTFSMGVSYKIRNNFV